MARTDLTVQTLLIAGLTPATEAANVDGEMFLNDGDTFLRVVNGGSGITVTLVVQQTVDGLAVTNRTISVGGGAEKWIGPIPQDVYNVASGADAGKVYANFSSVTSVTVGAYRI